MPPIYPKYFSRTSITLKQLNRYFQHGALKYCQLETRVRIAIPMSVFLTAGDPVDFTNIKTIGFAQNASDNLQHTLFVDDMRVYTGSGISPPASQPTGLVATGYDSHIKITWNPNPETYINGYEVWRSTDGGANFSIAAVTDNNTTGHEDWVRDLGTSVNAIYYVSALNSANEPSVPSAPASGSTRVFTDDELIGIVQEYTFSYFYDYAHPTSGMARTNCWAPTKLSLPVARDLASWLCLWV